MSKLSVRGCVMSSVVALAWCGGTIGYADGYRNPVPGGVGLGRGGVVAAQIEDPSAISYNPANLVFINKPSFMAAATVARSETKYTSPLGQEATTKDPWIVLPNVYGVWPTTSGKGVWGLGITTPYGQSTEWDKDSVFRYSAPYYAAMQLVNVNPTYAFRLTDSLSLGLGLDIYASSIEMKQMYPWAMVTQNPMTPDGALRAEGDGIGWGGNVGVTWKMTSKQRLALTYRSRSTIKYEGDFHVGGLPDRSQLPPPLWGLTSSSDFSSTMEFPDILGAGYGIAVTDKLNVEFDVEWLNWSRNHHQHMNLDNNNLLMPSTTTQNDWNDTWTYGVSAEWLCAPDWVLRAGYIFIPTPVPEQNLTAYLPDTDHQVVSLGVGYHKNGHAVDLAYTVNFYRDRDISDNQNPALNGKYETSSDLFGISYTKSF